MKCPKCKTGNPENGKYCVNCGEKLIPTGEVNPSPTRTLFTVFKDLYVDNFIYYNVKTMRMTWFIPQQQPASVRPYTPEPLITL